MPRSAKTTARGYGWKHQQLRKRSERSVRAGLASCTRCGGLILPDESWDLDHTDDRTGYRGPAHASCNRRAPRLRARALRRRRRFSRVW